jgi:uncharacterized repeat protein (TIGR01451 family)
MPSASPSSPPAATSTATPPVLSPHLSLQKTMDGHAMPGATVVYLITVANSGNAPTVDPINVVDDLPAGMAFQQVAANGWNCSAAPPHVSCGMNKALAPGQQAEPIRITVRINAHPGAMLSNMAVAKSGSMSEFADNETRVAGPAAPAPALSWFGILAGLVTLLGVARCRLSAGRGD